MQVNFYLIHFFDGFLWVYQKLKPNRKAFRDIFLAFNICLGKMKWKCVFFKQSRCSILILIDFWARLIRNKLIHINITIAKFEKSSNLFCLSECYFQVCHIFYRNLFAVWRLCTYIDFPWLSPLIRLFYIQ